MRAGEIAQSVKHFPHRHKDLHSVRIPIQKCRLVEHAGNPSTEEAEISNPGILASQPRLILAVKLPVESPCVKTLKL